MEANTKKSVVSCRNRFSFEKLSLRNERWGGGGGCESMHFLKSLRGLFKNDYLVLVADRIIKISRIKDN